MKKVKKTYTEQKWLGGQDDPRGDRGRIEDFYLNYGYVTARVGQPRITYTDKPGGNPKKPVKYVKLEIPIAEGAQYKMGSLKFEGLTVLKEPFVRSLFKMNEGDVYEDSRFKKAYEKLRDVYGSLGYFQWTGGTERKPDHEKKVVDVTVKMEMAGMPMAMPPMSQRVCVKKGAKDEDFVPRQENCRVSDTTRTGSRLTFKIACAGSNPMIGTGDFTFEANGYNGQIRMKGKKEGQDVDMTQAIAARRVGGCTAR